MGVTVGPPADGPAVPPDVRQSKSLETPMMILLTLIAVLWLAALAVVIAAGGSSARTGTERALDSDEQITISAPELKEPAQESWKNSQHPVGV